MFSKNSLPLTYSISLCLLSLFLPSVHSLPLFLFPYFSFFLFSVLFRLPTCKVTYKITLNELQYIPIIHSPHSASLETSVKPVLFFFLPSFSYLLSFFICFFLLFLFFYFFLSFSPCLLIEYFFFIFPLL